MLILVLTLERGDVALQLRIYATEQYHWLGESDVHLIIHSSRQWACALHFWGVVHGSQLQCTLSCLWLESELR